MEHRINVLFYARNSKKNSKGLTPIYIRLTINGRRLDQDFRATIKEELLRSDMVIQLISKNYKASEICLNEMGAAWVLSKKVVPFVLEDTYDVGFIHGNSQQLKINIKKDLLQFVDDYQNLFPKKSPSAKIDRHVNEFIKSIS